MNAIFSEQRISAGGNAIFGFQTLAEPVLSGIAAGGRSIGAIRHWSTVPYRKRKRIDELVKKEAKLQEEVDNSVNTEDIVANLQALRDVEKLLKAISLESEVMREYIDIRREEEDIEDIKALLPYL